MRVREIVIEQRLETEDDWRQEVFVDSQPVYFELEPMRFSGWGPYLKHLALWEWLRRTEGR